MHVIRPVEMNFSEEHIHRALMGAFAPYVENGNTEIMGKWLEIFEEFFRSAEEGIWRFLQELHEWFEAIWPELKVALAKAGNALAETHDKIMAMPASQGIEPLRLAKGAPPVFARGFSLMFADLCVCLAKMYMLEGKIIKSLRRISKARNVGLACRKTADVLLSADLFECQERVFGAREGAVDEFVSQFSLALEGHHASQVRVQELAREFSARAKKLSGPKPSAASVAREWMEEMSSLFVSFPKYTYDPYTNDFTDPITLGLRKEFDEPRFNPRPSLRRSGKNDPRG